MSFDHKKGSLRPPRPPSVLLPPKENIPHDVISIADIKTSCVVGIYPYERKKAQTVILDLEFGMDARLCALTEDLKWGLDYDEVIQESQFILKFGKFLLLETAAQTLANYFLLRYSEVVSHVKVSLRKPRLASKVQGAPSVTVWREASFSKPTAQPRTVQGKGFSLALWRATKDEMVEWKKRSTHKHFMFLKNAGLVLELKR